MIDVVFEADKCRAAAYDGDKLVGECNAVPHDGIWTIVHTGTDPDYRGQGIARRLVECIDEASKAAGVEIVSECSYSLKVLGH